MLVCRDTRLQLEVITDLFELCDILVKLWERDHHRGAETSPKVRWAGSDESKVLGEHELTAVRLDRVLNGVGDVAEPSKDLLGIAIGEH